MRRFVLLFFPLLVAFLTMTGAASAASGADRAKAAGIFVDPAVEPLMEEAPAGSCLSDPTLPDCPKTTAVVYAPDLFHVAQDERPFMPLSPTSAKAEQLRTEAAAAVVFNC